MFFCKGCWLQCKILFNGILKAQFVLHISRTLKAKIKHWGFFSHTGDDPWEIWPWTLGVAWRGKCFLDTTRSEQPLLPCSSALIRDRGWIGRVYSCGLNGNCGTWKGGFYSWLYRGASLSAWLTLHQNNWAFACQPGWLWEGTPGIWFFHMPHAKTGMPGKNVVSRSLK